MNEPIKIPRAVRRITPDTEGQSLVDWIKAVGSEEPSKQGTDIGERLHPFDFYKILRLKIFNVYHSASIDAKVNASVGMGFDPGPEYRQAVQMAQIEMKPTPDEPLSKAETVLNPLCSLSILDVLKDMAEDYFGCGNGFWEIVREEPRDGAKITGIHHIEAPRCTVEVEDRNYNYHWRVRSEGISRLGDLRFAKFGDLDRFVGKFPDFKDGVSEVIHFRRSTSLSRWYGMPDWISAVASIELDGAVTQHNFDFFNNRGVPEMILFLIGQRLPEQDWEDLKKSMEATIGAGNQFKTSVFNIADNTQVQLEKLAADGRQDMFGDLVNTLALKIVSAHRVPALLAGIQLPGKMGANNELPNALAAFHVLTIGPEQKNIETILNCTLGDEDFNGGLGLAQGDFKFKKITDELGLGEMEAISKMRQPQAEANAEGRNLDDGMKKILEQEGVGEEAASRLVGTMLAKVAESVLS